MPVKLSSGGGDDEGEEARIEIVPLIDIMFFLLASFMLVSLSMSHVSRVPIKVPSSSTALQEPKIPPVHLAIDANGKITWDQQIVTPGEITERLKGNGEAKAGGVLIGADEEVHHKFTMSVLDAVRAAGIDKVGFESRKSGQ